MTAINRFTGRAVVYSKYRPSYPEEYVDYLMQANALAPGGIVADVGSGTGILSGQLLGRGLKVLAVEPNADMRREAESRLGAWPAFKAFCGAAEETGLPDGSVDLVTAAQAFHWFGREKFKAECRRILKTGARVALVWNSRDPASGLVQENEALCRKYCPEYIASSGGIFTVDGVFEEFYRDGAYELRTFRNDERYGLDGFIGRNLSGSYAPAEGDANYRPFVEGLTVLFEKYNQGDNIILPGITRSYLGNV